VCFANESDTHFVRSALVPRSREAAPRRRNRVEPFHNNHRLSLACWPALRLLGGRLSGRIMANATTYDAVLALRIVMLAWLSLSIRE